MPLRLNDGSAYRFVEGPTRQNNATYDCSLWSEGYCGKFLHIPNDDHTAIRPSLDYVYGDGSKPVGANPPKPNGNTWTYDELLESAKDFLAGKDTFNTGDIAHWTLSAVLRIVYDIRATEDETDALLFMARAHFAISSSPASSAETSASLLGTTVEKFLGSKINATKIFEQALLSNPKFSFVRDDLLEYDGQRIKQLASALFDSTVIGSPSLVVPTILRAAIANYLEGLVQGDNFDPHSRQSLRLFAYEATRRYPGVVLAGYIDSHTGERTQANLLMAGQDEDAFGPDPEYLRIRGDLRYYHERSTSFADPAVPLEGEPGTARFCPGRSLALSTMVAFLEALDLEQWCVDPSTPVKRAPGLFFFDDYDLVRRGSDEACQEETKGESKPNDDKKPRMRMRKHSGKKGYMG